MKVKPLFIGLTAILATLWASPPAFAQVGFAFQQYRYAKTFSSSGNIRPLRIQADKYENTYVLGYYERSASFGNSVVLSAPGPMLYLGKFDPQGNAIWAKNIAGTRSWDQRGTEVAALFTDAEGHSYVSLLIDSTRDVAGVPMSVPTGQRLATITKFNLAGEVYFTKEVARGPDLKIPDYRPMCADVAGNIFFTLTVRAGTRVRYGPTISMGLLGEGPALIKLYSTGNYETSFIPALSQFSNTNAQSVAVSCNNNQVFWAGNFIDTLTLRHNSTGLHGVPEDGNPYYRFSRGYKYLFAYEVNPKSLALKRNLTYANPRGSMGLEPDDIYAQDIAARADSGCYLSYIYSYVNQGTMGSLPGNVWGSPTAVKGFAGAPSVSNSGIRPQYYQDTYWGENEEGTPYLFDYDRHVYSFSRVHSCPDGNLLIKSQPESHFYTTSLDNVSGSECVSMAQGNGSYLGTMTVKSIIDVCPMPGTNSFAVIGTVDPISPVQLPPYNLTNSGNNIRTYLARYTGTPPQATVITSFEPVSGRPGDAIRIKGKRFDRVLNLYFNGTKAAFTRNTDSTLTATVPAGTTTGPISLVASSGSPVSDSSFVLIQDSLGGARRDVEEFASRIVLQPNPATSTVEITGMDGDKPVVLMDLSGKEVLRQIPLTNGSARLNLTSLKPGLYLVRQGARTERLVKE